MSKILLCGDQHIHPHSGRLSKMEECLKTLRWIYSVAEEMGVRCVISLGDLFHDRERINTLAYHRTYDVILQARDRGITTYLLLGNHDLYLRESFSVHSLRALEGVAEVISEPKKIRVEGLDIDFLPFVFENKVSLEKYFPPGKRSGVLCSHLAVLGGSLNKLWGTRYLEEGRPQEEDSQLDPEAFEGYTRVFLGHFHSRSRFGPGGKIQYVGSPMQLNFGDAMDPRGVEILDPQTMETKFVENTFSPRYFILPYDEDLSRYPIKGSNLRLVVPSDFGSLNILDTRERIQEALSPESLEIVISKKEGEDEVKEKLETSLAFTENKPELLKKYLEHVQVPSNLDPNILLKVGLEMASL